MFENKTGVVSIGSISRFLHYFVPLEYIPTIHPRSTYIIVIVSYFSKVKRAHIVLGSSFHIAQGRLNHRYLHFAGDGETTYKLFKCRNCESSTIVNVVKKPNYSEKKL